MVPLRTQCILALHAHIVFFPLLASEENCQQRFNTRNSINNFNFMKLSKTKLHHFSLTQILSELIPYFFKKSFWMKSRRHRSQWQLAIDLNEAKIYPKCLRRKTGSSGLVKFLLICHRICKIHCCESRLNPRLNIMYILLHIIPLVTI